MFQAATKTAAVRANSLASELSIDLAGIKLGADISISVTDTVPRSELGGPSTVIYLEWEAANRQHLFPFMKAELFIYPESDRDPARLLRDLRAASRGPRERDQRRGIHSRGSPTRNENAISEARVSISYL